MRSWTVCQKASYLHPATDRRFVITPDLIYRLRRAHLRWFSFDISPGTRLPIAQEFLPSLPAIRIFPQPFLSLPRGQSSDEEVSVVAIAKHATVILSPVERIFDGHFHTLPLIIGDETEPAQTAVHERGGRQHCWVVGTILSAASDLLWRLRHR
jgi:hypothetical protein